MAKKEPYLYRKLNTMLDQYVQTTNRYEIMKCDLRAEIASKFRLNNSDMDEILKELQDNKKKRIERINSGRIRILD